MRSLLIGLAALILLGTSVAYLVDTNATIPPNPSTPALTTTVPTNSKSNDQTWSADIPSDHRLHAEPDQLYSIGLPYTVDVSSPQTGITRYRYVGPDNEPASEITDGYTVTVVAEPADTTSIDNLVSERIAGNIGATIQDPQSVMIAGVEAQRYVTESNIGNKAITHYTLLPGNNYVYHISVNLSPSKSSVYDNETAAILETLRFFEESTAEVLRPRIVPIAMLDYEAAGDQYIRESDGIERGCDTVVLIEHVLSKQTDTPLNAALQQLFAYNQEMVAGWQNFIASQKDTLDFDRASIEDEVAKIYLTGDLGQLGGVCDNPRTAIQIEETALAFDTVNAVEVYLNNQRTDLMPSGRGE